jgi:DNA-binding MarR family transcriptional regulator
VEPLKRVADRPTWLLSRANARAHAILTDAFAEAGVRGYHVRLLAALEQYGPSSQAVLGRATGMDRSDVAVTLDELTGWGLAQRATDPTDGRRNVVSITSEGLVRLVELDRVLDRAQEALLEPLSQTERVALLRLLRKLAG